MNLIEEAKQCKQASYQLMLKTTREKNHALSCIIMQLRLQADAILEANRKDQEIAKQNKKRATFIDRLSLDKERLEMIIEAINIIIDLEDPCDIILEKWERNSLKFIKKSVPIGVIGIIYEARPNVSVDAATLCLKSGNACLLRGSRDTIHSNKALVKAMKDGLSDAGFPQCIALVEDTSKETALEFMHLNAYLDVLIPRGGAGLIKTVKENATVAMIETGTGNCHIYVDKDADFEKAIAIILNAKIQRVSVCNACESILIHKEIANEFLPTLISKLKEKHVVIHGCSITKQFDESILPANDIEYAKEYLDYEVSIKVISTISQAIEHINHFNTMHSDVIISENEAHIQMFLKQVDSAVVYANASSRFSDGFEFGFGAEIGISTQKIHARGPMGLRALTSYKYQVIGDGTIRK